MRTVLGISAGGAVTELCAGGRNPTCRTRGTGAGSRGGSVLTATCIVVVVSAGGVGDRVSPGGVGGLDLTGRAGKDRLNGGDAAWKVTCFLEVPGLGVVEPLESEDEMGRNSLSLSRSLEVHRKRGISESSRSELDTLGISVNRTLGAHGWLGIPLARILDVLG
jgi:hypothetical protein